jgi:phenylacetate-CoA ligase
MMNLNGMELEIPNQDGKNMPKNPPYAREMMTEEDLIRATNRAIKYTVKLAYDHSSFYREKFRNAKISPTDVIDHESLLKAIRKGVRVTKQELSDRAKTAGLVTDYSQNAFTDELWTTGTSGQCKPIIYSQSDMARSNEQSQNAYNAMGLRSGCNVLSLFSPSPFASGMLSREATKDMGLHLLQVGPLMSTSSLIPLIKSRKPDSVWGLTTKMYRLPLEFRELGVDPKDFGVKSIMTAAEPSTKEKRMKIAEEWGAEAYDVYASTEASLIAYECGTEDGLHVNEERILLDFVDPDTLDSVEVEERGTDLLSTLYREGEMPATILLGYSHGDVSRFLDSLNSCGRTLRRMDYPTRDDYVVSLAGYKANVVKAEIPVSNSTSLTGEYVAISGYDEVQRKPTLEIRAEAKESMSDDVRQSLENQILSAVFNNPAATAVFFKQCSVSVKFMNKGHLYEGLEKHLRQGKPIRFIRN